MKFINTICNLSIKTIQINSFLSSLYLNSLETHLTLIASLIKKIGLEHLTYHMKSMTRYTILPQNSKLPFDLMETEGREKG